MWSKTRGRCADMLEVLEGCSRLFLVGHRSQGSLVVNDCCTRSCDTAWRQKAGSCTTHRAGNEDLWTRPGFRAKILGQNAVHCRSSPR